MPVRPNDSPYHTYTQKAPHECSGKLDVLYQTVSPNPQPYALGAPRDVPGIVFVCKPSTSKLCWEILHQARSPKLLDAEGNVIERPSLIRKRKRNSSLGVERIPKRNRKSLTLNPHHSQLD